MFFSRKPNTPVDFTCTGSLSILVASFRANGSLILSTSFGMNEGNTSAVALNRQRLPHFSVAPKPAGTEPATRVNISVTPPWRLSSVLHTLSGYIRGSGCVSVAGGCCNDMANDLALPCHIPSFDVANDIIIVL